MRVTAHKLQPPRYETYGEYLRKLRLLNDLNQTELANLLHINQIYISAIERGILAAPDRIKDAIKVEIQKGHLIES